MSDLKEKLSQSQYDNVFYDKAAVNDLFSEIGKTLTKGENVINLIQAANFTDLDNEQVYWSLEMIRDYLHQADQLVDKLNKALKK